MRGVVGVAVGCVVFGSLSAQAADLPVKAVAVAAPAFNWTGWYAGGHIGALHSTSRSDESGREVIFPGFATTGLPAIAPIVIVPSRFGTIPGTSASDTGIVLGGQLGYNWQTGKLLYGLEGDASWTNTRPRATVSPVDPFAIQTLTGTIETKTNWIASIRGRLGLTYDRLLFYGTGGIAFTGGRVNSSFTLTNPIPGIFFPIPFSGTNTASSSFTAVGWTLGAGAEWMFAKNWSLAGEYRHYHFGARSVTLALTDPSGGAALGITPVSVSLRQRIDQATLRLNYHFNK